MKSKKCKGCNHSISRHYVIVDHNGKTASQYCKTCGGPGGIGRCSAIRKLTIKDYENLTTDKPILKFWAWKYYERILRPNKPKPPVPKGYRQFIESMRAKEC
jgi:hypothetical protein